MLRIATEEDMPQIMKIEHEAFVPPWSQGGLLYELLSDNSYFLLYEEDDIVFGFALLRKIGIEGELLQIAVDSRYRRRHVATDLISEILEHAVDNNLERVFLEVRESNEAAISLYKKHGFKYIGRRKNYYISPTEDSLTMQRLTDIYQGT